MRFPCAALRNAGGRPRHVVTYSRNGLGPDRDQAILVAFAAVTRRKPSSKSTACKGKAQSSLTRSPLLLKQFEECPRSRSRCGEAPTGAERRRFDFVERKVFPEAVAAALEDRSVP